MNKKEEFTKEELQIIRDELIDFVKKIESIDHTKMKEGTKRANLLKSYGEKVIFFRQELERINLLLKEYNDENI